LRIIIKLFTNKSKICFTGEKKKFNLYFKKKKNTKHYTFIYNDYKDIWFKASQEKPTEEPLQPLMCLCSELALLHLSE